MKLSDRLIIIVETKEQKDLDVPLKMARLRQWCEDIDTVQSAAMYDFVHVDVENCGKHQPTSFRQLLECFKEYKGVPHAHSQLRSPRYSQLSLASLPRAARLARD